MDKLKNLIKDLTEINGNSGYEDEIIRYVYNRLKNKCDEITVDSIGNVTAKYLCGKTNAKRIMLFAHMDEVGMVVRKIEDNGLIRAEKLGSINPNVLPGQAVEVIGSKGKIVGVIGAKSHHFLKPEDKYKVDGFDKLYIDIGAISKENVYELGVEVGNPIVMQSRFNVLANNMICNKAMDDRALLAILVYLGENIRKEALDCDLYLVFSVQEEFNIRGIMPVVRDVVPDIAIGLDVTPSCDVPDIEAYSGVVIGKGPALTYMNHHGRGTLAGLVPNIKFLSFIENICKENNIPVQREVALGVLTETAYILFENSKTVVANISIPTRYTHTPVEVVSLEDILYCYNLLSNFLKKYESNQEFGKFTIVKEG
ncbi:M42 family metallopeptidase [Brassicibacter mesophilus]|uniref:M42 family metallopeptidase n=1 Tax=Brassicibacter mesophilus TaxID=745119 RepID=UPI003D1F00A4